MRRQVFRAGRALALVGAAAVATVLGATLPTAARIAGGVHDFRNPGNGGPNTKYANLAELAGRDPCGACHKSHAAAKSEALFGEDFGWTPTSTRIALPSSGLCMSCHDGYASFGPGQEEALGMEHTVAKQHRRHRVEFPYPAPPGAVLTPGRVVMDSRGRPAVEGPGGVLLPLYRDPTGEGLKGGCGTCHEPHGSGNPFLLRVGLVRQLCPVCHGAAKPAGAPAAKDASSWSKRWQSNPPPAAAAATPSPAPAPTEPQAKPGNPTQ